MSAYPASRVPVVAADPAARGRPPEDRLAPNPMLTLQLV